MEGNCCSCGHSTNCGCPERKKYTPARIYNPAGQSSLSYRVGTHAQFKADMVSSIASQTRLQALKTRDDSDLSIAILDSWALVADVLSFYQERIANEGFLRTATERRSVLELARSIGYELGPGVAASAHLAFSMETSPGSPRRAKIPSGSKVQSIPAQDELPQTFETMEDIEARKEWNAILPRQVKKQDLKTALKEGRVVLEGTSTLVRVGDGLLFVISKAGKAEAAFVIAREVLVDAPKRQTVVLFDTAGAGFEPVKNPPPAKGDSATKPDDSVIDSETHFTYGDLRSLISFQSLEESELQALATLKGWSVDKVVDAVNSERESDTSASGSVYAFRVKCGVFGNSAPLWSSLPPEMRFDYTDPTKRFPNKIEAPYPHDWDTYPVPVNRSSRKKMKASRRDMSDLAFYNENGHLIYLDNVYPSVKKESWVILANPSRVSAYYVAETADASLAEFAQSAKATGTLLDDTLANLKVTKKDEKGHKTKHIASKDPIVDDLGYFFFRDTVVYCAPEKVELADVAVTGDIQDSQNAVILDGMVGNLVADRPVIVSGELAQQPGVMGREVATVSKIVHFDRVSMLTTMYLSKLQYSYRRETVTINANVALATHGETKQVPIGSGDPAQRFQAFELSDSPLTFVPAANASGAASTLKVVIDGVEWEEKESFENLDHRDKAFVTRRSDGGKTTVIFGDGVTGRLPPAGAENIQATYRVGIGMKGLLKADQLSQLLTRPLGVSKVTNPLATSGAGDPEKLDDARKNAPRTVLTMDRIVSLEDYKNFAQGFQGIGKAGSYPIRIGNDNVVLVAVATASGAELKKTDNLYSKLEQAIENYKDPASRFILSSFKARLFDVDARIKVSSDRKFEDVQAELKSALKETFSFEKRNFGQAVTLSEVVSVMQGVEGVVAVEVKSIYDHDIKEPTDVVRARDPNGVQSDGIPVPVLLLINADGISLDKMEASPQ
ncbi:conserved hypothetical protein, phage tail-like region [Candidatus Nitrososphaera evergladensis SR1]|uniref:Uncharacterized protein n=1 Tax=Candidatus Nitrososphaera evergladensis SR1 TaxID=1459636 RepID=A0A075MP47_9ARCH|nr:putative baseplate assembly protein [Candidatus Nitrososphaera evergladensis]AIF82572.1 conserved hypothetical protein, phage tail-like region [Candidatus Nitrososphaera evergladensis SR1]